jgi:hypothetical protein
MIWELLTDKPTSTICWRALGQSYGVEAEAIFSQPPCGSCLPQDAFHQKAATPDSVYKLTKVSDLLYYSSHHFYSLPALFTYFDSSILLHVVWCGRLGVIVVVVVIFVENMIRDERLVQQDRDEYYLPRLRPTGRYQELTNGTIHG